MRKNVPSLQWTVGRALAAACAVAFAGTGCEGGAMVASQAPPSNQPAVTPSGEACQAIDLAYQSDVTGAANGNLYDTVTIVNLGPTACLLNGYPGLLSTDANGRTAPVPVTDESPGRPVLVTPGGTAEFAIHTVNEYAGYDPSSPHCAHPVRYWAVQLDLPTGRVPLGGLEIDVKCDGVGVTGWGWPDQ